MRFYLYFIIRYLFISTAVSALTPSTMMGTMQPNPMEIGADSTRIGASDSAYGKDATADIDTMNTGLTSVNTVDSASGEQWFDKQLLRTAVGVTFSLFSETHEYLHVGLAFSPNSGLSSDAMRAQFYQARGLDKVPYIATVGNIVIGYALCVKRPEYGYSTYEITKMWVDDLYRRLHIGSDLLQYALRHLRARLIAVYAICDIEPSRRAVSLEFFERNGFTRIPGDSVTMMQNLAPLDPIIRELQSKGADF